MLGFMLWCAQILGALFARYGGLRGALGWDYIVHRRAFEAARGEVPPPQTFAAAVTVLVRGEVGSRRRAKGVC
jgi:hypothetical protein